MVGGRDRIVQIIDARRTERTQRWPVTAAADLIVPSGLARWRSEPDDCLNPSMLDAKAAGRPAGLLGKAPSWK